MSTEVNLRSWRLILDCAKVIGITGKVPLGPHQGLSRAPQDAGRDPKAEL